MYIQCIEQDDATANIFCVCCGHAIVDWSQEHYVQPCEHALFVAMDLGFEFIADRFEMTMHESVDMLHEDPNHDIFQALKQASYPQVTLIKTALGVQDLSRYVGVSPILNLTESD